MFKFFSQKGQSLVEATVALSIIFFGILAVYGLAARAISLNRVVADRYVAIYLGSEGIEIVKNLIDSNILQRRPWNEGLADGIYEVEYGDLSLRLSQNRPLMYDSLSGSYNYTTGKETLTKRLVKLETLGDGEELRATAKVDWRSRGGDYSIELEEHFFNWR